MSDNIRFQLLTPEHIPDLQALIQAQQAPVWLDGQPWTPDAFWASLARPDRLYFRATKDNACIGYVGLTDIRTDWTATFSYTMADPEPQPMRRLLAWLIDTLGLQLLHTVAHERQVAFLRRLGFRRDGVLRHALDYDRQPVDLLLLSYQPGQRVCLAAADHAAIVAQATTKTQMQIAEEFGITQSAVSKIIRRSQHDLASHRRHRRPARSGPDGRGPSRTVRGSQDRADPAPDPGVPGPATDPEPLPARPDATAAADLRGLPAAGAARQSAAGRADGRLPSAGPAAAVHAAEPVAGRAELRQAAGPGQH